MFMLQNSDKFIKSNIHMSGYAYYNKVLRPKSDDVVFIIEKSLPEFKKLLNLPKGLAFRVAPIKAKRTRGVYIVGDKLVEIDPRQKAVDAFTTLAHELVHAEQYHEGRLKIEYLRGHGQVHMWNGEFVTNKGSTYQAYRDQPWEKEAFERQEILFKEVSRILDSKCP